MSFISPIIDTKTKDYQNLNGQIANGNSLESRIYQLLVTPRSGWLYAPFDNYGSELYALLNKRGIPNKIELLQMVISALEPLTSVGDFTISNISVPNVPQPDFVIKIEGVDSEGNPVRLSVPPLGA